MTNGRARPAPPVPIGPEMSPIQVVIALRWVGELSSAEIAAAIQAAADLDVADRWPELTEGEVEELRRQARTMTGSRLRSWTSRDEGKRRGRPTWLEVRALILGLRQVL